MYYRKRALKKLQRNFVVLKKIHEIFDINTKNILGDNEIIICNDYSDIEEYNDEIRNFRNMNIAKIMDLDMLKGINGNIMIM